MSTSTEHRPTAWANFSMGLCRAGMVMVISQAEYGVTTAEYKQGSSKLVSETRDSSTAAVILFNLIFIARVEH